MIGPAMRHVLDIAATGQGDFIVIVLARRHRLHCACERLTWCKEFEQTPQYRERVTRPEKAIVAKIISRLISGALVYTRPGHPGPKGGVVELTSKGRTALAQNMEQAA
jgi:hypothetical protein